MNDIIIVNSIDEITKCNVKYAHASRPNRWIQVDKDSETEYCVYGMVTGEFPQSVTTSNWQRVKVWKTFKGVIRALKLYSKDGSWGMRHWGK